MVSTTLNTFAVHNTLARAWGINVQFSVKTKFWHFLMSFSLRKGWLCEKMPMISMYRTIGAILRENAVAWTRRKRRKSKWHLGKQKISEAKNIRRGALMPQKRFLFIWKRLKNQNWRILLQKSHSAENPKDLSSQTLPTKNNSRRYLDPRHPAWKNVP